MITSSATKNTNKFYYSDLFISYIISFTLHLFVAAMLFISFNTKPSFNIDNFIVTSLVSRSDIEFVIKKEQTINASKALLKNTKSKKIASTPKAEKQQSISAKKLEPTKPEAKTNINDQKVNTKTANANVNVAKEIAYYSQQIQQEITQNWKKPYAFNVNKPSIVQIKLDAKGNILNIKLLTSSNNKLFDESIIQAIESSSPLKSIKTMNTKTFTNNFTAINLNFNPEDLD